MSRKLAALVSSSSHRSATGASVTLAAEGYDLTQPWFVDFRIMRHDAAQNGGGLLHRALQIAPWGNTSRMAAALLNGPVVERLRAGDGTYLIARGDGHDHRIVAWQGHWHEVFAWVNGGDQTVEQDLSIFDGLSLSDSPAGLTVTPPTIPRETLLAEELSKHVPGVGMLQILPGASGRSLLPSWTGASVRVGEVWRKRLGRDGGERSALILGTRSSVAIIMPEHDHDGDLSNRLRFVERVTELQWTA